MNIQEQRAAIFSFNEIHRIAFNEAIKHEDVETLKTALFDNPSINKHLLDLVKNICDAEFETVSSRLEDIEGHPRMLRMIFEFTITEGTFVGGKTLGQHYCKVNVPVFIHKMLFDLDRIYLSI